MNKRMILRVLGIVMGVEAALLLFPFVVGLIYQESCTVYFAYTSIFCFALYLLSLKVPIKNKRRQ